MESDARRSDSDLYRFLILCFRTLLADFSFHRKAQRHDFQPHLRNSCLFAGSWARAFWAAGGRSWATSSLHPTRFPSSPLSRLKAKFEGEVLFLSYQVPYAYCINRALKDCGFDTKRAPSSILRHDSKPLIQSIFSYCKSSALGSRFSFLAF